MNLDVREYWNERYSQGGNSGDGSYGEPLQKKLKWLSGLDVKSVSDVGCGDFNFGKHLMENYPGATYWGYDVSDVIITQNQKNYPQYHFTSTGSLPRADLVLCLDVLFHTLEDSDYEGTLRYLESLWGRYLAITAYERDPRPDEEGHHIKIRKFDYRRFGEPIIREIIEEDGQLYFYLFEKKGIDISKVSCVLNTKEMVYPKEVLDSVTKYPFGEILIKTHSESPHCKYELIDKAKYDLIYYQDDDAICPISQLASLSDPAMINLAISEAHFNAYKDKRMAMGFGWGSFFNRSVLKNLKRYTDVYGEDDLFKRDTEKLLTHLVFPQNRFILPIRSLPSALAPDRLSRQSFHYDNMALIEERCKMLIC